MAHSSSISLHNRGGKRTGAGRKPRPITTKYLALIRCSPEEWGAIKSTTPEERGAILLEFAIHKNQGQGQI